MPASETTSRWTVEPLVPTAGAIDKWLSREDKPEGAIFGTFDHYSADIKTKASQWRHITSRVMHNGEPHYWTITAEGSSNASREYAIPASKITEARGHFMKGEPR